MALVKLQPDSDVVNNQTTIPETLSKPNESVFTTLFPEAKAGSLLKYVEGYPWTVNYYGQILNTANSLNYLDPTIPAFTSPYYEVLGMVIQVTSPLNSSYDQSTGITASNGSALLPLKTIPNVGDLFIAQIDSGEDAIFIITAVSRKTYRKETLYEVDYSLHKYVSGEPDFIANLKAKIQDTYYFNKDTNFFNRDVLITPSVKEATDALKRYVRETQEFYFSTFAQKGTGSIFIPGLEDAVYDPLLMKFLDQIVDYDFKLNNPYFKFTFSDRYIDQPSIFDLLLKRNVGLYNTINQAFGFVPSASLRNYARFGTVYHAGVNYIIYPHEPNTDLSIGKYNRTNIPLDNFISTVRNSKNYFVANIPIQTNNNNTSEPKQLLHELFEDDLYVVSNNFYRYITDNTLYDSVSFMELLILRFIKREAIARSDLVLAIQNYYQWSPMHQLYLLPVLWLMIMSSI